MRSDALKLEGIKGKKNLENVLMILDIDSDFMEFWKAQTARKLTSRSLQLTSITAGQPLSQEEVRGRTAVVFHSILKWEVTVFNTQMLRVMTRLWLRVCYCLQFAFKGQILLDVSVSLPEAH